MVVAAVRLHFKTYRWIFVALSPLPTQEDLEVPRALRASSPRDLSFLIREEVVCIVRGYTKGQTTKVVG